MPGRPARKAAASAPGSISGARLVLTMSAVGFMRARSAAVTMPRVAGDKAHVQGEHIAGREEFLLAGAASYPSARARASESGRAHTATFMPNALPYPATTLPMRP